MTVCQFHAKKCYSAFTSRVEYGCLVTLVTPRDNHYIEEAQDIREEGRHIVVVVSIILLFRK